MRSETRLDRWATLSIFDPLTRWGAGARRPRIPVLMYHEVADHPRAYKHPYYQTATSVRAFEQQVRFLSESGYRCIGLSDVLRHTAKNAGSAGKCIAITFDDGYENFYTHAFPILSKYGFTATVFLPTAFISDTRCSFNGFGCLTWSEVRYLNSLGIEFGSHTVDHPQLRDLHTSDIERQLRRSKSTIEDELGSRITSFAYPYAFPEADRKFVPLLRRLLVETGYEYGVSSVIGTVTDSGDRFFMPRLPVNSGDDTRFFTAKLQGAYDWLHTVQYVRKLCW